MADIIDDPAQAGLESLFDQVLATGVGIVSTDDGSVFMFTTAVLERLLEASRKSGKAVIFVRRPTAQDKS